MFLQPSTSFQYNDKRLLFAAELMTGGHGQVYLSGGGTFVPTNSSFIFYRIDFTSNTIINNVGFRTVASDGVTKIYEIDSSSYQNVHMSDGTTWYAPITSINLTSGKGIAYQYSIFDTNNQICKST